MADVPFMRSPYNYDRREASRSAALGDCGPGKTQQHFKEDADINTIVRRFLKTGVMPENVRLPSYVDYEGVFDFQSAMNTMMDAEREFMRLPADVRKRFDNDPQKLLEFVSDAANLEEARSLGLARPAPAPAPAPASVPVPAPAPAPAPSGGA